MSICDDTGRALAYEDCHNEILIIVIEGSELLRQRKLNVSSSGAL